MTPPDQEQLVTGDGIRLAASWWEADEPAETAIVLVHGFAAGREDAAVVATAESLRSAGFDVLACDGRGHGTSEGTCTLGDRERFDVDAGVARAGQDHGSVVVVGASMGAIAALRYAALDRTDAVRGVVAVSCPATWALPRTARAVLAAGLTQTPPGRYVARRTMAVRLHRGWDRPDPPIELMSRIDEPVALVHGVADRFIRPQEAAILAGAARGPVRVDYVAGMGHAFHPLSRTPIDDAVRWCLDTDAALDTRLVGAGDDVAAGGA